MKKQILKLLLAIGIIAFAASMLAVSCGKTGGGGNSANNSGSGGNGNGNGGCTGICPTTNLALVGSARTNIVKINSNNTVVYINATALEGAVTPHSDADDNNRGYHDTSANAGTDIFEIEYPGGKPAIHFISRAHVTKDTITMAAVTTGTSTLPKCTSSESGDNALASAAGGAHCRIHYTNENKLLFSSYLGTVFNNTNTATARARGLMYCGQEFIKRNPVTDTHYPITDTLTFDAKRMGCYIGVVNSAGAGAGAAAAEIDDAWVGDDASVKEVELYAIGINVEGKTIPQWSDAPGYGLTEFKKAHDNAAFKRLLRNNEWADLKFKVRIVTAAAF